MTVENRIEKLERQCWWYRSLFILSGLIAVAMVTWGATKPIPDVIKARKFAVPGLNGRQSVAITNNESGGIVLVGNSAGDPSVVLMTNKDGSGYIVAGAGENAGISFFGRSLSDTGGEITIHNKTGEGIVRLYADEYGNGVVGAFNREGRGRKIRPGS